MISGSGYQISNHAYQGEGANAYQGTFLVTVTGVSGTSALGNVTVLVEVDVAVSGVLGITHLGNVLVASDANVTVVGVSCRGFVSSVNIWGIIVINQTPNWSDIVPIQTPAWSSENPSPGSGWTDINP